MHCVEKNVMEETEGNRALEKPRHRCEDNIENDMIVI
jgi:hypothetical protein